MEDRAVCIICECGIPLVAGTVKGEILLCPDCGTELEILSMDPVQVAEAPEVEEDWGE